MEKQKNFKEEKKLKFTQFWNLWRVLGKISIFKNFSLGIWGWSFLNIFLRFLGFWGSFSYKNFSCKKKRVLQYLSLTPSQNGEIHIHLSQIETGLSEEIKFCTRKMIKRTHLTSLCKMIILFQDVVTNVFLKNVSCR